MAPEITKRTILLAMYRRVLSEYLITLTDTNFNVVAEQNYALATLAAETCKPDLVLVEIPESGQWRSAEKCLALCDMIRSQFPHCKQVILCDEKDTITCQAAIQARQEQRIDDFLFYTNSTKYMFSKLEALAGFAAGRYEGEKNEEVLFEEQR